MTVSSLPGTRLFDSTIIREAQGDPAGDLVTMTELGLHLSQQLSNRLGGHSTFHSEYGVGSTFTLVLPEQ